MRHAIGYAIDRDAIVRYLRRGLANVAFGLMPPQAWAFEPQTFQFTFDPAQAMHLLDEAGHPRPGRRRPAPRLQLSLRVSTSEEARLQAAVVQANLARVGHRARRPLVGASHALRRRRGAATFEMFSLQFVGGGLVDPDMMRRVFHSRRSRLPASIAGSTRTRSSIGC